METKNIVDKLEANRLSMMATFYKVKRAMLFGSFLLILMDFGFLLCVYLAYKGVTNNENWFWILYYSFWGAINLLTIRGTMESVKDLWKLHQRVKRDIADVEVTIRAGKFMINADEKGIVEAFKDMENNNG